MTETVPAGCGLKPPFDQSADPRGIKAKPPRDRRPVPRAGDWLPQAQALIFCGFVTINRAAQPAGRHPPGRRPRGYPGTKGQLPLQTGTCRRDSTPGHPAHIWAMFAPRPHDPPLAIALRLLATVFIAATTLLAKALGTDAPGAPLHPFQISHGRFLFVNNAIGLTFATLVFATLYDLAVLGAVPDAVSVAGAGVIVAGAALLAFREARLARAGSKPA